MAYPKGVADILPLTAAQRGMLFHVEGDRHICGQYVAVIRCTLRGPLDPDRLKSAMCDLLDAHDALRAGFVWKGVKQPVQVVQEQGTIPWTELDWTEEENPGARLTELLKVEQLRQFDLTKPPLMAATLIRGAKDKWHFVWTIHHLISDGWSTGVAFQDLFNRYAGTDRPFAPASSFKTYLTWLHKRAPLTDTGYWTGYLAGLEGPCVLPVPEHPGAPASQVSHSVSLGEDLMHRVRGISTRLKITPNTLLSAAWALVLRRYLKQNDVVFGTTTAGRPPEIPNVSRSIGAYINTLPMRLKIDPSQPVEQFLQDHARAETQRLSHEYASLAEVQTCAPCADQGPLFDTLFVNEGVIRREYEFGDIHISGLKTTQFSNYPLAMLVSPHSELGVEVYSDPTRIPQNAVRNLVTTYQRILSKITAAPETQIRDLLSGEYASVSVAPAPKTENIIARFLKQAERSPQSRAISDGKQSLTYAELSHRARQIAFALRAAGVQPDDIVPVALPRSVDAIAGFLGVMMSGAAYVPMDLDYPQARLAQMLETARPRFLVTTQKVTEHLPKSTAQPVFLENLSEALNNVETGPRAYVMFTSGSENKPKGVMISHSALALSTAARDAVYDARPQAYLLLSSLAFDSSVAGLYWTLCTGGHLVIAPKRAEQQPKELGKLIARHSITHTLCLPGLAQALLTTVPKQDLQSLKVLIAAGEALSPSVAQALRLTCPQCRLVNEYGPTEGTVWCTAFDATDQTDQTAIPIGTAIPGTWVGIVDLDDGPAQPGEVGEIVVAGGTVADGYLHDTNQTRAQFFGLGPDQIPAYRTGDLGVADAEGSITFLGRKDKQVKIRGHRVELTEIEEAARTVAPTLRLAAVVLQQSGPKKIVLALECESNDPLCTHVERHVKASLPEPFHPNQVIGIECFPTLPNGKLDQSALIDQIAEQDSQNTGEPPKGPLERKIAELFSAALKTPCDTRDAHFFDLGGDSLTTITAYAMAQETGLHFEPTDLFSFPTVADLARRVAERQAGIVVKTQEGTVQVLNPGPNKTTVIIADCSFEFSRYVARNLGSDYTILHIPSYLTDGIAISFDKSIAERAADAISHIPQSNIAGPFALCGYSAGCPLVMEIAEQVGQKNVLGMVLLDPPFKMIGAEPSLQPFYYRTYKRWRYFLNGWKRRNRARRALPDIQKSLSAEQPAQQVRTKGAEIANEVAISRFRAPVFNKPTHVFLTQNNPSLIRGDVLDTHLPHKQLYPLDMQHDELMQRSDVFSFIASKIAHF